MIADGDDLSAANLNLGDPGFCLGRISADANQLPTFAVRNLGDDLGFHRLGVHQGGEGVLIKFGHAREDDGVGEAERAGERRISHEGLEGLLSHGPWDGFVILRMEAADHANGHDDEL